MIEPSNYRIGLNECTNTISFGFEYPFEHTSTINQASKQLHMSDPRDICLSGPKYQITLFNWVDFIPFIRAGGYLK